MVHKCYTKNGYLNVILPKKVVWSHIPNIFAVHNRRICDYLPYCNLFNTDCIDMVISKSGQKLNFYAIAEDGYMCGGQKSPWSYSADNE